MQTLDRDGTALAYTEAGSGSPPLVFVHGFGCDNTAFAPQVEHFRSRHRVVAVDLRGFGASDKPQQRYSIAAFADDVAWLCGQLGLSKPVVIGHSLGGQIALELAARHPELPAAIVSVDGPILTPQPFLEAMQGFAQALHKPDYRDTLRTFVGDHTFLPTDDPETKAQIVEKVVSNPHHVVTSAVDEITEWAGSGAVAAATACKVPVMHIHAAVPLADTERFRKLCPQLIVGQTVGSGHYSPLIVPEQVNAMLERFLFVKQ